MKTTATPVVAAGPVLGLLFALSIALACVWALKPHRGLLDFGSFYMAGVTSEQGLNPYAVYPDAARATGGQFGFTDGRGYSPNLNPPVSVYPFRLLAGSDPARIKAVLNAVSVLLFAGAAAAMLWAYRWQRRPLAVLWLASFAAVWYTVWLGQIYVLLFLPALAAWLLLERERHPLVAGLLIGLLVAVKPYFVLWPVFLLLAGHRRAAVAALLTAGAISLVPLAIDGPQIYRQWLDAAAAYSRLGLPQNASLPGEAQRLGVPALGYALAAAVAAGGALAAWRLQPSAREASAWGIVVTLLAGPITWLGYTLFALPVLLSRHWRAWEWLVAVCLTGVWFAFGIGEVYVLGLCVAGGLLATDARTCMRESRGEEQHQVAEEAAAA